MSQNQLELVKVYELIPDCGVNIAILEIECDEVRNGCEQAQEREIDPGAVALDCCDLLLFGS